MKYGWNPKYDVLVLMLSVFGWATIALLIPIVLSGISNSGLAVGLVILLACVVIWLVLRKRRT